MSKYQNDLTINPFTIKIESLLQFNYNTDFNHTAQKMKFSIKGFLSKCEETADLVTFTAEILHGKLPFLCSDVLISKLLDHYSLNIFSVETKDLFLSLHFVPSQMIETPKVHLVVKLLLHL